MDVFVAGNDPATPRELRRRPSCTLDIDPAEDIVVATPEAIIVHKLCWYRLGDHISERRRLDAVNVLEVRGAGLGQPYMRDLAEHMNVADLQERIPGRAGLDAVNRNPSGPSAP